MSYDLSGYSAAQQAVIVALISKAYGVPEDQILTDYIAGQSVSAGVFNARVKEIEGILSYLEDQRRDESARAQGAEQYLNQKFARLISALAPSANWIITEYTGSASGNLLTLQNGEVSIAGDLFTLPYANYQVTFTNGVSQVLVAHDSGAVDVRPNSWTDGAANVTVGYWNGTVYAPVTQSVPSGLNDPIPAHHLLIGPVSGSDAAPVFRALVKEDLPTGLLFANDPEVDFQGDVSIAGALTLAKRITQAADRPTSGTHAKGDVVLNSEPSAGSAVGWLCITAGTPGTWKPMGYLPNIRTVTGSATVNNQDVIVNVNAPAAATITLPDSTWDSDKELIVKDVSGDAVNNPVSFTAGPGTTIGEDPAIDSNYGSRTFYLDGAVWRVK